MPCFALVRATFPADSRQNAVVDFGESALVCGLDILRRNNCEALRRLDRLAELAGTELEQSRAHILGAAERENRFGGRNQWHFCLIQG